MLNCWIFILQHSNIVTQIIGRTGASPSLKGDGGGGGKAENSRCMIETSSFERFSSVSFAVSSVYIVQYEPETLPLVLWGNQPRCCCYFLLLNILVIICYVFLCRTTINNFSWMYYELNSLCWRVIYLVLSGWYVEFIVRFVIKPFISFKLFSLVLITMYNSFSLI